ncbi:phage protein [Streptococcus pneumoniae]|nr:phage protein [Streptococcus pneumoniae]VSR75144.1 phage protein [Streptococcus pneumoniae]
MKLNELIKKYKKLEGVWNAEGAELARQIFLQDLEQLDKPQPVKVKKFVADFIAEQKKLGHTLSYSIDASMSDIVAEWYWDNSELFALAWIFGCEVEKEKRYFVKIKGNIKENMLVYGELLKRYFFTKSFSLDDVIYSHTRKELEDANFGWVFDCPGIEIEEVEYDTNA